MEIRKQEEALFHDMIRDKNLEKNQEEFQYYTSNMKYYSVVRGSFGYRYDWLKNNCKGKKVLDFCCGNGKTSFFLAENGADAYGIDISPVSVENAREAAKKVGLDEHAHFFVMDAEKTNFEDNFFDMANCFGVLHHLDIEKAYAELSRVVKPDGKVICNEALIHNPIIQLYRVATPHMRTEWETEHILGRKQIKLAKKYFKNVDIKFFHLTDLAATPFRNTFLFNYLLKIFETIDSVILRIPGIRWWAWHSVFIMSEPIKKDKA